MKALNRSPDWAALEALLDSWFTAGLSRHSILTFDSSQSSWETGLFAASLFKRGAQSLRCFSSGEVRDLNHEAFNQLHSKTMTSTAVIARFDEFFAHPIFSDARTAVLCDSTFLRCHPKVETRLKNSPVSYLKIECSEENKSLRTARGIFEAIPKNATRLIVMGGGICCDIGGFVAGMRALEIHLVPTTLLAAVDAGLGGKTGVNHHRAGKNQIGLFVSIASVFVVTEFLTTLQSSQLSEGLAEILKHAFLSGRQERWQEAIAILQHYSNAADITWDDLRVLLMENLDFKKQVVAHDPFEKNIRALLNYGHTTAHLLEALIASQKTGSMTTLALSHGCAVAVGQLCFHRLGWAKEAPQEYPDALLTLLQQESISLPLAALKAIEHTARGLLLQDKKNTHEATAGLVRCVTPRYGCLEDLHNFKPNDLSSVVAENTTRIEVDVLLTQLQNAGLFS
jgi:3-dehydroquinate synthase